MSPLKITLTLALVAFLFVGAGCQKQQAIPEQQASKTTIPMSVEKVSFVTQDGVTIVADYYSGAEGGPAALLVHMMPATKESWRQFAAELIGRGFSSVLAIDLRGHGGSRMQGEQKLDYRDFEDEQHQAKIKDMEAAMQWLEERGATKDRLALVGASIGANLSIAYGAANAEIPTVVALSPGLNYRGVTTLDKMGQYAGRELYLAASAEDGHSFETDRQLYEVNPDATLKELENAGHGTTMFEKSPGFMAEVVDWVVSRVK